MNIETATSAPLPQCPECKGEGVVFSNASYDESTDTYSRDDNECPLCYGAGAVRFPVLDEYNEWNAERDN